MIPRGFGLPPAARELGLATAVCLALLVVVFPDVVFRGRTLLASSYLVGVMGGAPAYGAPHPGPAANLYQVDPGASAWHWEPLTAGVSRLYRRGRLPLWSASQGFGAPLAANMQSAAFYFPALPLLLHPTPAVWNAYLLARLLFAGLATFAVMRLFDTGMIGATGAAAAFMLSGYFLFWLNNAWLSIDVLVPALVYGVERVVRRPAGPWIWLVGITCSLAVLGGMPESTFVVLLCSGGVAAFRLAALRVGGVPWPAVARSALTLLAAVLLGIGTSAVLLVPFVEYLGQSWHQHTAETATGLRYFPVRALITLVAPYVDGPPLGSSPVPLYYAGMVAVTLAVVGALTRRETANWVRWCFLAVAGLGLAKAYGGGLNWIGTLPLFALVDFPKHLGVVICFAVAVLAGLGLDAAARGRVSLPIAIGGPLAVQGGAIGLLAVHGSAVAARLGPGYFVRGLGVAAALAAAVQLALLVAAASRRAPRIAALACAGLLVGELVYLAPKVDRARRHRPDATPPAVSFVRQDRSAYRVFGLDGVLYPNTATFFDLRDIRGLDALYPERYLVYVRELVNPTVFDRFTGAGSSSLTAEAPSRCGGNPWFDLLGVKYVFAPRGWRLTECSERRGEGWLAWSLLNTIQGSPLVGSNQLLVDGVWKPVLFQHPPGEVRFDFRPEARHRALSFSVALDSRVWSPDKGDGVRFEMTITAGGQHRRVFSRWVDPKNDPADRRWIPGTVDLTPYVGQEIEVVLTTQAGTSSVWDWAGWGDLRVEGEADPGVRYAGQYSLVYDGELRVFRNATAMARAFVVHRVETVSDRATALRRLKRPGFDPAVTVVLEGASGAAAPLARDAALPSTPAVVLADDDDRVTVATAATAPGILVLTDVFYPGWVATVDGAPAPIYPADYAFRGVAVPAGEHVVEFAYRPTSFAAGAAISGGSLLLLAALAMVTRRRHVPEVGHG